MGRQINFFMVGEDEAEFIDFVLSQGDVFIDRFGKVMTREEVIQEPFWKFYIKMPQSELKKHEVNPSRQAAFVNFMHSRGVDTNDPLFGKKVSEEEARQQPYESPFIDEFDSNVIEYHKSHMKNRRIEAGRLYAEFIGYDKYGNKFRKEKWLEDKYNLYKKWVMKHCKISKDKDRYIGKATYRLYKDEGYKMVGSLNDLDFIPGEEFD